MEHEVTQRVKTFLDRIGLTVNALSKVLGIGQPTLSKQMKDGGCGVSITTIVLLLNTYKDLSAEWLMRGDGSMEKGKATPVENMDLVAALRDHIATLKETNQRLSEEIAELKREKSTAARMHGVVGAGSRKELKG